MKEEKNLMTATQFLSFQVKRFRSLMDVTLDISQDYPTVICGENNIGKTNFLRALNLFFNHSSSLFLSPQEDLPYHIKEGSGGARMKTELIGKFKKNNKTQTIKIIFHSSGTIEYKIDNTIKSAEDVCDFLNEFRFILIESHNVNLPQLIAAVLEKDGLLQLDKKRGRQSRPLEKLQEFITLSELAIADIERDINVCFEQLTDFDGILKDKKVKIYFAEFEKLRDVVKTMTEITLFDGNSLRSLIKISCVTFPFSP
jgi:predicted ATP-dependent endonuclease of OLD family